jgi:hypothetical protein
MLILNLVNAFFKSLRKKNSGTAISNQSPKQHQNLFNPQHQKEDESSSKNLTLCYRKSVSPVFY